MGIQEIEQAIRQLSPKDLARFRQWFEEFDAQNWDKQFEADAKSGKLDKITEKALRECFLSGRVRLENDQIHTNLPDRPQVYRMAINFWLFSSQAHGTPTQVGHVANNQCHSVCSAHGLPVAHDAQGSAAVANCVWLLSALEETRSLGAHQCRAGENRASEK